MTRRRRVASVHNAQANANANANANAAAAAVAVVVVAAQHEEDEELMRLVDQQLQDFDQIEVDVDPPESQDLMLSRTDEMENSLGLQAKPPQQQSPWPSTCDSDLAHHVTTVTSPTNLVQVHVISSDSSSQDDSDEEKDDDDDEEDDESNADHQQLLDAESLQLHDLDEIMKEIKGPCRQSTATTSAKHVWRRRAQAEMLKCHRSQAQNQQLRSLLGQQVAVAHHIHQEVVDKVQQNRMLWEFCDSMKALTDARRRKPSQQLRREVITVALETASAKRYKRLIHRLDFTFQQLQLVFHGHSMSVPKEYVNGWLPYHDLSVRHVQSPSGKDFVELVGSTVTCFDANTLSDLLWTCFANKKPGPCGDSAASRPTINCSTTTNKTPAKQEKVGEDTVHWEGDFDETLLGLFGATFESNTLIRRRHNIVVVDGIGHIKLRPTREPASELPVHSFPAELDFNRTVWYRVDPLEDGRSVVHHVHRAQPLEGPVPDPKSHEQIKMAMMTQVLQRAHFEMSCHCHKSVMMHCLDKTRVQGHGWPMQGVEF